MAQSDALSELRWALGFQRGLLVFGGPDTLVSACGNQVCFQEQSNGAQVFYRTMAYPGKCAGPQTSFALQRLLTGAARGIDCFQVNIAQGLIAYAEKVQPAVQVCCRRIVSP